MARWPRRRILTSLVLASLALQGTPASAFELFGVHLWGEREDEDEIEIIDPQPYTVTVNVSGGEDSLQKVVENASSLWKNREKPASGNAGLLSTARGDYRRILAALYGEGYYGPEITILAAGQEVSGLTLDADFPPDVPMQINITAGPRFLFGRTAIINAPPAVVPEDDQVETPAEAGFVTGETARAGIVTQASALSVEKWRQLARPKAQESDREVIADHETERLDVSITLDPGPTARYGRVTTTGSRRTDADFITYMAGLPEGHPFDPDDVADAEDRLNRLGIFSSLRIVEAETVAPDGTMPMTIEVEDREPRTIGFGGTYSTIDGLGLAAYWVHRNLFGRAERLRYDASIDGLLETTDPSDYDYNFGVTFTKPGVITPDTSFVTSAVARQLDFDTYRERSVTGRVGLTQYFGGDDEASAELFAEISRARYEDDFGIRNFMTYALSGRGTIERRDVPLDATRGYWLQVEARPFYEAKYGNTAIRTTVEGRAYHGFGEERRVVLAGRAKVGSYFGPDAAESPPDMLFFAGGGGSIRGYAYRSIGVGTIDTPDDENFEPITVGGSGLLELSGELRWRFSESWGAVGFVDSGLVALEPDFSGGTDLRTGVGLGVRYYTGIGVLRADLATPINPRPEDSAVALYIGIGQAF